MQGRSLELYFVDGTPDGMLTAEVFNWTGHLLVAPRTQITDAIARPEAAHTGVYLLLGELEGEPLAYVGEAENVAKRIKDHDARKDWWSQVVIITTSADSLHKAHVKYLEARLVEMAHGVKEVSLENGNLPPRSSLSEASIANMEEFLETLSMVLPALGITMFKNRRRPTQPQSGSEVRGGYPRFKLETPRNKVEAFAELRGSDFVVLKGSRVRRRWEGVGRHDFGYRRIHGELVASGVIDDSNDPAVIVENFAFNSSSAAAAVANGRPANGRIEWKVDPGGQTFADWENERLHAVPVYDET